MDDVSIIKSPDIGDDVEEAVPLFASDAEAEPEVEEAVPLFGGAEAELDDDVEETVPLSDVEEAEDDAGGPAKLNASKSMALGEAGGEEASFFLIIKVMNLTPCFIFDSHFHNFCQFNLDKLCLALECDKFQ